MVAISLWLPSLPPLLALVALRAIAGQIFQPASRAAIPAVARDRDLDAGDRPESWLMDTTSRWRRQHRIGSGDPGSSRCSQPHPSGAGTVTRAGTGTPKSRATTSLTACTPSDSVPRGSTWYITAIR